MKFHKLIPTPTRSNSDGKLEDLQTWPYEHEFSERLHKGTNREVSLLIGLNFQPPSVLESL